MRILALLVGLFMAVGCSGNPQPANPPATPPSVEWSRSATEVVFQIFARGGFMSPLHAQTQIPELTIFGDGRAVFVVREGDDQLLRETKLSEQRLGELLAAAERAMADLKRSYAGAQATDMTTTNFYLATAKGKREVSVYGFSPQPWEQEQDRPVMDLLRSVRKSFMDAAASGAKPYIPVELTVMTEAIDPQNYDVQAKDWPAGLPALPGPDAGSPLGIASVVLKGEEARKVAEQVPLNPRWPYKSGDRYYLVALKPTLPEVAQQQP